MKLFDGLKKLVSTIGIIKDLVQEGNEIKNLIMNHNSDSKAIVVHDEKALEALKKDGKVGLLLPGPERPDVEQIKAYGMATISLTTNLLQAVVAKLGGKD